MRTPACSHHRAIRGGAVALVGECQQCAAGVSSGCGPLPKLCAPCGASLRECVYCRKPAIKSTLPPIPQK